MRKDKIIKDFIILNPMKNFHIGYIGVTEGKTEKEGKMIFNIFIFIYTIHLAYLKVYTKFHNSKSSSC